MAGPRSISSSTRVAAPAGSGKYSKGKSKQRKGGKQKGSKKGAQPLPTWDHDNSSGDEADGHDEPAAAATNTTTTAIPPARKKRPRPTVRFAEIVSPNDGSAEKTSTLKRQRPDKSKSKSGGGDDESSSSGGDGEEGEGRDEEDQDDASEKGNGGVTGATSAGGMGDVMARILGQKLDNRIQVGTNAPQDSY